MLKLYHFDNGKIDAYHEAWVSVEKKTLVEHFGNLGEPGQTFEREYDRKLNDSKNIEKLLTNARSNGFSEFDEDKFDWLIIELPLESGDFASGSELDQRYAVEDLMNEVLGWTGLGHCDGGSSGQGTMEIACPVVDYEMAQCVAEAALGEKNFTGYRIYKEDRG